MISEAQMEKKACDRLRKEYGAVCIKFGSIYDRSWPDRSINLPGGLHFYIEFKRPGKKLTPLQAQRIKELRDNGHAVYVCRSVDEAIWSAEHFTQIPLSGITCIFMRLGIDWRRDSIPYRDAIAAGIAQDVIDSTKWLNPV